MTIETKLDERLTPEPEVRIFLECPACLHAWEAASVLHGVWWGRGVTPDSIAKICYCPSCHADPPMRVSAPAPLARPRARKAAR